MLISPPEVSALLQQVQPTIPLFQIIDGYQDIQSVVAVLQSQQTFGLDNNLAHFKGDGPLEIPDEQNRMRYLGYVLADQLNPKRPIHFKLSFGAGLAEHPFVLMLRSFSLHGKRQIQIQQGFTVQSHATTNASGQADFEFDPLSDWLKDPSKVTGFNVFFDPAQTGARRRPVVAEAPPPEANQSGPFLNVLKHIDTKV